MEAMIPRKALDCRKTPSVNHCSLRIAGTEDEVMQAAVQHAITAHGHADSPELRAMIRGSLEDDRERMSRPSQQRAPA
jgi:predicted small metal-binding protein